MRRLWLMLTVAARAGAQFDDGAFGQPRSCPAFRCGADKVPVPKRPMKLESTGCANMGGGMQMFTADEAADGPTRPCCDRRNACYGICGASRKACDEGFKDCAAAACAAIADDDAAAACDSQAKIHNLMVGLGDCASFDKAQRRACDCVAADRAPKRREQSVADFYKRHDPAGAAKAPGLAAKADSPRKLATLLTKLVAKFPASIAKVADERQAWLEDLMRKGADAGDDDVEAGGAGASPDVVVEGGAGDAGEDVVDLDAEL